MQKIIKIILVVLGLVAFAMLFLMPDNDAPMGVAVESTAITVIFSIAYLLMGIAVAVSLFFSLKTLFSTPESLKKALYVIGGLVVIVGLAYALAKGDNVSADLLAKTETTEGTVKAIGTGLNVFFFLTIIAVALMLWSGIKKLFAN